MTELAATPEEDPIFWISADKDETSAHRQCPME